MTCSVSRLVLTTVVISHTCEVGYIKDSKARCIPYLSGYPKLKGVTPTLVKVQSFLPPPSIRYHQAGTSALLHVRHLYRQLSTARIQQFMARSRL